MRPTTQAALAHIVQEMFCCLGGIPARIASGRHARVVVLTAVLAPVSQPMVAMPLTCGDEALAVPAEPGRPDEPPTTPSDLIVDGACTVVVPASGEPPFYAFRYVNVVDGGTLTFVETADANLDFRASSILIQQGGMLAAGAPGAPFGSSGGTLTLGLWGDDPTAEGTITSPSDPAIGCVDAMGSPIACHPDVSGGATLCCTVSDSDDPCSNTTCPASQHNALFEPYGDLVFDPSPFGYKTLAVSYGGSLELFGSKGVASPGGSSSTTCPTPADPDGTTPENEGQYDVRAWAELTGTSWVRLDGVEDGTTMAGAPSDRLVLDREVDWQAGDQLVVTTTDWHASHTETVTIDGVAASTRRTEEGTTTVSLVTLTEPLEWPHRGTVFDVDSRISGTKNSENPNSEVDLRPAVGLLTRSIRIVSLGQEADQPLPTPDQCGTDSTSPECYFGGHVVVRQGFRDFQLQGVELYQLGQGGRMGHYPVHFHLDKDTTYTDAFVTDSSIWDSMTRFVVVHGTHDVALERNVGFLSVGHGFYLEDASEIDNLLCQNLAVSARASIEEHYATQSDDSPEHRYVPPILDSMFYEIPAPPSPTIPPARTIAGSDTLFPTLFWIANGANEFVGNLAVGAQGWGACYWLLGAGVSGASRHLSWTSGVEDPEIYADFNLSGGVQAPLRRFRGNGCSTAAYALMTELASVPPKAATPSAPLDCTATQCQPPPITYPFVALTPLPNTVYAVNDEVYNERLPRIAGNFNASRYGGSNPQCRNSEVSGATGDASLAVNVDNCVTTVIDRLTTSFNWAEVNLGSVWLRPKHFVFSNGAITDQLFGGLGFVSGGSWDQAPPGYFSLTRDSVYIGTSQDPPTHGLDYAAKTGPNITNDSGAPVSRCSPMAGGQQDSFCYFDDDGVGFYTGGFNSKRMISIYDGPFFAEGNVFLETPTFTCKPWIPTAPNSTALESCGIYALTNQPWIDPDSTKPPTGVVPVTMDDEMEVVDAAVGWKQPNGFYYPPAFAFLKSDFDGVTERHNVFDQYTRYVQGQFQGNPIHQPLSSFGTTPVDSTTLLIDLDGTLTGMGVDTAAGASRKRTSSLSLNTFFDAPSQDEECLSFGVQTSPYDQVTTTMARLLDGTGPPYAVDPNWALAGSARRRPTVGIYRHLRVTSGPDADTCTNQQVCEGTEWGCDRAAFMMGTDTGQAPFLTSDRGLYTLDTSVQALSCLGPGVSGVYQPAVFEKNKRYLAYHLFASPRTRVAYQVYVGTGFDEATFEWVRVHPHQTEGALETVVEAPPSGDDPYGTYCFDSSTGILTVELDNSTVAGDFALAEHEDYEQCMPRDICQVDTAGTGCELCQGANCTQGPVEDDLAPMIDQICKSWVTTTSRVGEADTGTSVPGIASGTFDGVYLADCPGGGCLGFTFELPDGFAPLSYATIEPHLLATQCFPQVPWKDHLVLEDMDCPAPPNPDSGNFCAPGVTLDLCSSGPAGGT